MHILLWFLTYPALNQQCVYSGWASILCGEKKSAKKLAANLTLVHRAAILTKQYRLVTKVQEMLLVTAYFMLKNLDIVLCQVSLLSHWLPILN